MIDVAGEFSTTVTPADLIARNHQPECLGAVNTLAEVRLEENGRIRALFTARTPLGRIPLHTIITTHAADHESTDVHVHASRGPHTVDVDLHIDFERIDTTTRVSWRAQVHLGGAAASVGQRVVPGLAQKAIDEVLQQLAQAR
jgi:carbon monoxide dehydrogenase subunit G